MTQATRRPRAAAIRWWRRPDRGSTSVEMVGYTAIMLFALLVGVQASAWGLAELACRYAASHALQTTRVEGGTAAAGESDAHAVLDQVNANLVTGVQTTASRDATTATVTIRGTALRIVPFLSLPVGATLSAPVEDLAGEGNR